jgi:protein SCO1/2
LVAVAAVILVVAGLLVARRGGDASSTEGTDDWAGTVLPAPQEKPAIELTTTEGQPFDLVTDTEGRLTLMMFGYTNCPDVCPISLATLKAALDELGPEAANAVDVVFITADPERDTPERLRAFLDQHDADFIGLTGDPDQIARAQQLAEVPAAVIDDADANGDYAVLHSTQMIAYQPDGMARIVYPFGTRQQDWLRDLPRLIDGEDPSR